MASLEEIRNTFSTIVAVVGESGDLSGRVRLQKLGYLLQQRGFRPLEKVQFSYHYYGPYSDQLAGALEQVVASGLVRERERESSNGRKMYTYDLDRQHPDNEYLELPQPDVDDVREFMGVTKDAHWRTLELAATVVYLERDSSLPRDAAFTRALGLKPDCQLFRQEAETLLSALGFEA